MPCSKQNGELSVLKKPAFANAKQDAKADLSIPSHLPTTLIIDGAIMHKNLKELNLTEEWLMEKLRMENAALSQFYFAQVLENNSLYISLEKIE